MTPQGWVYLAHCSFFQDSIEKHISQSSSNEDTVENSVKLYGCSLRQNNIMDDLKCQSSDSNEENENAKSRKRELIRFNSPYSRNPISRKIPAQFSLNFIINILQSNIAQDRQKDFC